MSILELVQLKFKKCKRWCFQCKYFLFCFLN